MKWLLLLPLLLVACGPSSWTQRVETLERQVAAQEQVNRIRFDHLLSRIEALECAVDPARLNRIGLDCPPLEELKPKVGME